MKQMADVHAGLNLQRGRYMMKRIRMNLRAVFVVVAMFLFFGSDLSAQTEGQSSPKRDEQQTEGEIPHTVVDMPFASVAGDDLISSTGGHGEGRRWLVQRLASGEPKMMHRAYPRFPIPAAWNVIVMSWRDTLTYVGASDTPVAARQRGFPKWRVNQGRLMFYWGWGFDPAPILGLHSGFFLIPFQDNAIDYRLGEWHALGMKPDTKDRGYYARRIEAGRLHVRSTTLKYSQNTPVSSSMMGSERKIIDYLYSDRCAGCDFAISSDGEGLFFTCPLPENATMREDLPSKMIVFDFSTRDEEFQRHDTQRSAPVVRRESRETDEVPIGLVLGPRPEPEVPESLTTMEWVERGSFEVPFSVPFTVAVDDDCYFFVTNGGAIHRASPASGGESRRICEVVFRDRAEPIIACIHDASTNRIFAFRRESYIPVNSEHFPEDRSPRFIACPDITRSKRLFYSDEHGIHRLADARFRLLSEAARVLREDAMCR